MISIAITFIYSYILFLQKSKKIIFLSILSILSIFLLYLISLLENVNLPFELTYGSDAFYYWLEISSSTSFIKCSESLAPFHVCVNSANILFSGNGTHVQVVILSILTYVLMHLLLYNKVKLQGKDVVFFIFLFVFLSNFIVVLTVIRGMKEVWVLLSYVLAYFSLLNFFDRRFLLSIIYLSLALFVSANLKPYGFIFVLTPLLLTVFIYRFTKIKLVILLFMVLLVFVVLKDFFGMLFDVSSAHAKLNDASGDFSLSSFFRFILGPGPYYSLEQMLYSNRFLAYTKTGDMMIFLGSVQWYILLSLFFCLVVFNIRKFLDHLKSPLIFFYLSAVFYIFVYAITYDGTGDTRHRAVMYFLLSVPFAVFIFSNFQGTINKFTRENT
ncbi:MAG: hypothetical protein IBX55_21865 [Methyloprofundus sp.]|nr:hypothetical protein [Methyloprofundus sp.]